MFAEKSLFSLTSDSLRDWFGFRVPPACPADEAEVTARLAELPAHDAYAALHDITAMLDAFAVAKAAPNREALVRQADAATAAFVVKLNADYLALLRGQASQEARLWQALNTYWLSVERAYVSLLGASDPHASEVDAALIARAITALSEQAKLARVRYCAIDPRIWRELGRLLALAEKAAPGGSELVMQAWARVFLREIASPQNLLPREIEIVDRLAHHYATCLVHRHQASSEAGYHFDLGTNQAPLRHVFSERFTAHSRFFGAGESYHYAELAVQRIEQSGGAADLPIVEFMQDEVLRMLRHVARHWSPTPPVRGEGRSEVLSRVLIVYDLNEIRRKIAKGDSQALAQGLGECRNLEQADINRYGFVTERSRQRCMAEEQVRDAALTENWLVQDESGVGFGAEVPSHAADWLCAGKLVGFKREGAQQWGVGVIRRVEHNARALCRVGIQVLSEQPRAMRLRVLSAAQKAAWDKLDEAPSYEYRNAILLAAARGQEPGMLLLPAAGGDQQAPYFEWLHGEVSDLLTMTKPVMHASEFDLLMFRFA